MWFVRKAAFQIFRKWKWNMVNDGRWMTAYDVGVGATLHHLVTSSSLLGKCGDTKILWVYAAELAFQAEMGTRNILIISFPSDTQMWIWEKPMWKQQQQLQVLQQTTNLCVMMTSTLPLSLLQTVLGQKARFMFVNLHRSCSAPDLGRDILVYFGARYIFEADEELLSHDLRKDFGPFCFFGSKIYLWGWCGGCTDPIMMLLLIWFLTRMQEVEMQAE